MCGRFGCVHMGAGAPQLGPRMRRCVDLCPKNQGILPLSYFPSRDLDVVYVKTQQRIGYSHSPPTRPPVGECFPSPRPPHGRAERGGDARCGSFRPPRSEEERGCSVWLVRVAQGRSTSSTCPCKTTAFLLAQTIQGEAIASSRRRDDVPRRTVSEHRVRCTKESERHSGVAMLLEVFTFLP